VGMVNIPLIANVQEGVTGKRWPAHVYVTFGQAYEDGTFEDTPVGTCFTTAPPPPPNLCIPVVQHFQLVMPGVASPYPISTVTSRTDCEIGNQITINPPAPPPAPAVKYTFGTVN
jgi:hypothetical protein